MQIVHLTCFAGNHASWWKCSNFISIYLPRTHHPPQAIPSNLLLMEKKKQHFPLSSLKVWLWNHSPNSKSWKHTRMFLRELELFPDHQINSSWNLMQFQQNILHRKFPFICRKPFTWKPMILLTKEYWNQWNIPLNGSICMLIIEKETSTNSSNSHLPNHMITKKLRIYLDPCELNEALEWEPYYSRSVDKIIRKFHGYEKWILDGCITSWFQSTYMHGTRYWNIPMDQTSNGNCHSIRYISKKIRWSICKSTWSHWYSCWQGYLWNFHIEHDRNFIRFLKVTRRHNLHLNKDKLQFHKETLHFFGHWWNKDGISPDGKKIKAIMSMEFPSDKETMQNFLGPVNFLNRYSANLVELSKSLHDLCVLHAYYKVSIKHMEAFQAIKSVFASKIIPPYHDCTAPTTLQTDSSKKGLGSVLMQHEKPIYFASRSITKAARKLPEFGKRNTCHHLSNGIFPLLSIWKGIHPRNWLEASCFYIQ